MRTKHETHAARPVRPSRWGFTLVELLLVMFILSVLVGLIVGVSWYVIEQGRKQETLSGQKRLMAAIDAYRKVTGSVPNVVYKPDLTSSSDPTLVMSLLLTCLRTGSPTGILDVNSPLYRATLPFLGDDSHPPITPTTDAYGKSMLYLYDGGVGGKPVIVSAGPDGKFGYEKDYRGNSTLQKQYQKDNIRSDMN